MEVMIVWAICSAGWLVGCIVVFRAMKLTSEDLAVEAELGMMVVMGTMFAPVIYVCSILFVVAWTLLGLFRLACGMSKPFGDVPSKVLKFFAKFEKQTVPFPEVTIVEEVAPVYEYNWSTCTHCGAAAVDSFHIKHLKTCQYKTKGAWTHNTYKPKRIVGRKVVKR